MKKYKLYEATRQLPWNDRYEIEAGCTLNQSSQDPTLIKEYPCKEEALNALGWRHGYFTTSSSFSGTPLYDVTEYYVSEIFCNEDGDEMTYGDEYFCKMQIFVTSIDSNFPEKCFETYREAEKYLYEQLSLDDGDSSWQPFIICYRD